MQEKGTQILLSRGRNLQRKHDFKLSLLKGKLAVLALFIFNVYISAIFFDFFNMPVIICKVNSFTFDV